MNSGNHWDPRKGKNYQYIDFMVRRYFDMGGVGVLVHAYMGAPTVSDDPSEDIFSSAEAAIDATSTSVGSGYSTIQDPIFGENRDRLYSYPPYELKMIYNLQEIEWAMLQFGLQAQNTFFIETHLNDCLAKLGRKIMVGDVLQFRNMRDDALLNPESPAIDAFFQVTSVARAMDGWGPEWYPHILRMQVQPITDSQEFQNITIENPDGTPSDGSITDILSDNSTLLDISQAIEDAANKDVRYRNFNGNMLYVIDSADSGLDYPYLWTGDGRPPNSAKLAGKGKKLPTTGNDGDWFLLTRSKPEVNILYQYKANEGWVEKECDFRIKWEAAGRILTSFINDTNVSEINGVSVTERQPISKVVRPRGKSRKDI